MTTNAIGPRTTGKVRPLPTQNEALLFEKSSPGKRAYMLPPLDVPTVDTAVLRLVVRDVLRGRAGSLEVRLPLPRDGQAGAVAH